MVRKILPDKGFYEGFAAAFASAVKLTLKRNERISVALSGGKTPRGLYDTLVNGEWRKTINWSRIDFFFGDERDVSPMSEKSNFRMANEFLFKPLEIPATQIFRWQTEIINVAEVAVSYEKTIRRYFKLDAGEFPVFDLLILGMGDDGHTASLFPATDALNVVDRIAVANRVEKFDSYRLTLTFPVINNAKKIFFMAYGSEKAPAVREVLEGTKNCAKFPAQCVEPTNGKVTWFVSSLAAADLSKKSAGK